MTKTYAQIKRAGRKVGHTVTLETRAKLSLKLKEYFKVHPGTTLGRKHTERELQKMRGANSVHWRGGATTENKRQRNSWQFKLWREAVFKRDDWTCQDCKKKGGNLHPHHVKAFALFPELRFAIDNGLTLCEECHRNTDSWGRGKIKIKTG